MLDHSLGDTCLKTSSFFRWVTLRLRKSQDWLLLVTTKTSQLTCKADKANHIRVLWLKLKMGYTPNVASQLETWCYSGSGVHDFQTKPNTVSWICWRNPPANTLFRLLHSNGLPIGRKHGANLGTYRQDHCCSWISWYPVKTIVDHNSWIWPA